MSIHSHRSISFERSAMRVTRLSVPSTSTSRPMWVSFTDISASRFAASHASRAIKYSPTTSSALAMSAAFSPRWVNVALRPLADSAPAAFRASCSSSPGMNLRTARRTPGICGTRRARVGLCDAQSRARRARPTMCQADCFQTTNSGRKGEAHRQRLLRALPTG